MNGVKSANDIYHSGKGQKVKILLFHFLMFGLVQKSPFRTLLLFFSWEDTWKKNVYGRVGVIIIITAAIFIAPCLTGKDEHTALYKINNYIYIYS